MSLLELARNLLLRNGATVFHREPPPGPLRRCRRGSWVTGSLLSLLTLPALASAQDWSTIQLEGPGTVLPSDLPPLPNTTPGVPQPGRVTPLPPIGEPPPLPNEPAPGGDDRVIPFRSLPGFTNPTPPTQRVIPLPPLPDESSGSFPLPPPNPNNPDVNNLGSLNTELLLHGGSYLYEPEGEGLHWPGADNSHGHSEHLRLPESWVEPKPITGATPFLGTGPVNTHNFPLIGYAIEPRFVLYGEHQVFGFSAQGDQIRRDAIGHNLTLEFDYRLTGTERFHVQYLPIGEENSGGSYLQLSNPHGYIDNSTAEPERYWVEGELHSLLGPQFDPFGALDLHIVFGKYPLVLHNRLLMNDNITGVAVNKNTIFVGDFSNVNVQYFYAFDDIDTDDASRLAGINVSADYRKTFYELTYAFVDYSNGLGIDTHHIAISRTKLYGQLSVAGRAMFRWGDAGNTRDGQLFVLETNYTQPFHHNPLGLQYAVLYANAFYQNNNWGSIGGGGFNRLRTSFEVNPLTRLAAFSPSGDRWGVSFGSQFFRCHEDESFLPEFAIEGIDGDAVFGTGIRYLRKTSARSFLEVLTQFNFSDNPIYDQTGFFAGHTYIF